MEETYLDRVSAPRSAGIPSKNKNIKSNNSEGVASCLTHEVTYEEEKQFDYNTGPEDYKLPPPTTNIFKGFNTDVKECVQPDANQSFLDVLRGEFQDTVYDSYWNKPVGRVADQTPMLPAGMNPITTCFGRPTPKDFTAGELVNPPKSYVDVMEESRVGHDMYKQTHNDYDPGEQTDRHYVTPYQKDLVWGTPTPCDPQGGCMRKVMTVDSNDKIFVSKILADHRTRSRDLIGKVLAPNNNIACVPTGHAFGKLNKREALGAGELLKDCPPSLDKVDLYEEVCHINTLRQQLAKKHPSHHRDLIDAFHKIDVGNTGCLPMDKVYQVLSSYLIFPEKTLFEGLMCRLNILCENGTVAYERLAGVLNVNAEFPDIAKIHDVPREVMNFETTNQSAHKYHCSEGFGDTKNTPTAGLPPQPYVAIEGIVSPNIFSHYGLSPKDFFISRSPEYLRTLFQRIGYGLDDTTFGQIWNLANDGKGCVSVHSFFSALKKYK